MRKPLREALSSALPAGDVGKVYNSFDIIGDIAIIKVPAENAANAKVIAEQIMDTHRHLKAVYGKASPIVGDFRVRELTLLAGENQTSTTYKEAGCFFRVDVEKCYVSPRLSYEHQRIASLVKPGEAVVNMFAGVGGFSMHIAKTVPQTKVYSIDINPTAYQYMQENIALNGVEDKVVALLGDSKDIVEAQLQAVADRVLMPLPEKALEYLPTAVSALKEGGGWIHYYDFQHTTGQEKPTEKTKQAVALKLDAIGVKHTFENARVIRPTGPNWYQTVLDIRLV